MRNGDAGLPEISPLGASSVRVHATAIISNGNTTTTNAYVSDIDDCDRINVPEGAMRRLQMIAGFCYVFMLVLLAIRVSVLASEPH
ncbi:hypothetical protein CLOP_g9338 [Closterium sp. NIES-67]|nr:hypothetical protein CLOP_g9338 [Closterium sp. NIES-67]